MNTKHRIYRVTTELLLSETIYIVAKTPEEAIEAGDSAFEMRFNDMTDTYETTGKCERVELWQLENVLNALPACLAANLTTEQLKEELKHRKRSVKK